MSLLAKRVAEVAKQSPTAISLPKSALLGYSSEILRKTSLVFCLLFFSVAPKYSRKRSTEASLLRLKPFELKLTKKNKQESTNSSFPEQRPHSFSFCREQ